MIGGEQRLGFIFGRIGGGEVFSPAGCGGDLALFSLLRMDSWKGGDGLGLDLGVSGND